MFKKIHFLLTICLFLFLEHVDAQTEFYKTYTDFLAVSGNSPVVQLPDSGYVFFSTRSISNQNQALYRVNKFGNVIWAKYISISTSEKAGGLFLTENNQLIFSGYFNTNQNIFRIDLNGNFISQRRISNPGANNIQIAESADNKIYTLSSDVLVKQDSLGNVIWSKKLSSNQLSCSSINVLPSGNLLLTGIVTEQIAYGSNTDRMLVCLDPNGTWLYSKAYGSSATEGPGTAVVTADEKVLTFFDYTNFIENERGIGVLCTDTLGNQLWTKIIKDLTGTRAATVLKDGTILIIAGDAIVHMSTDGQVLSNCHATAGFPSVYPSLCATNDGGFALTCWNNFSSYTGFYKAGPNLRPSCFNVVDQPTFIHEIVLEENPLFAPSVASFGTTTIPANIFTTIAAVASGTCANNCSTTASFFASSGNVCMSSGINFINNSFNYSSCEWKVDGLVIDTGINFSYIFNHPGYDTVMLVVHGPFCSDSTKQVIHIDSILVPSFTTYEEDLQVKLMPVPANGTLYTWNFGDESVETAVQDSVWHIYPDVGTYTVCLKATNACGTAQACRTIALNTDIAYEFYKTYQEGTANNQYGSCAIQAADGGYFIGGMDDSFGPPPWDGLLMKVDSGGNPLWTKIVDFGNMDTQDLEQMSLATDGDVIISGTCSGSNGGYFQMIGRVDSLGAAWVKTYSCNNGDKPGNSLEMPDGSMIYSGGKLNRGYLIKTDRIGNVLFYKEFTALKYIRAIRQAPDHSYFVFGNEPGSSIAVMKLDSSFNFIWAKKIGLDNAPLAAYDMQLSSSGKLYMTGAITISGVYKTFILCTDSVLNTIWVKSFLTGEQLGRSMQLDRKGNVYVSAAKYEHLNATGYGFLIKTDSSGNVLWTWHPVSANARIGLTHDDGIIMASTIYGYYYQLEYSIEVTKIDSVGPPPCGGVLFTASLGSPVATVTTLANTMTGTAPTFTSLSTNATYHTTDSVHCSTHFSVLNASFSYTGNCIGNNVAFRDLSQGNIIGWNWNFSGGNPSASSLANPISAWNVPGNYIVTLTVYSSTDTATSSQTITINAAPSVNAGPDQVICFGDTTLMNGSGSNVFNWMPSSGIANSSDPLSSAFPQATTTYFLQVTNSFGCVAYDTMKITVSNVFTPFITNSGTTLYSSETGTIYQWYLNGVPIAGAVDSFYVYTQSGYYQVQVGTIPGCWSSLSPPFNIFVPLAASFSYSGNCIGSNVLFTDLSQGGATSWSWAFNGGNPASSTQSNPVTTWSSPGTYTVTLTVSNSTGSSTSSQVITINSLPLANAGSDQTICQGNSATISATGGGTYSWNGSSLVNASGAIQTVGPLTTTNYVVTVTNNFGCSKNDTVAVIVNPLPLVSAGSDDTICMTDTMQLNASGTGSFAWSPIASLNNPSIFNPIAFPSATVTYTLALTGTNGCVAYDMITITVVNAPAAPGITGTGNTLYSSVSGTTYQWYLNGNPIAGAIDSFYVFTQPGTYTLQVANASGCWSALSSPFLVTGIGEFQVGKFDVFPNPGNELFIVQLKESRIESLNVYNELGELLFTKSIPPGSVLQIISMQEYASGVYYFSGISAEGICMRKIILIK